MVMFKFFTLLRGDLRIAVATIRCFWGIFRVFSGSHTRERRPAFSRKNGYLLAKQSECAAVKSRSLFRGEH